MTQKLSILFLENGFSYIAQKDQKTISEIIEIDGNSNLDFLEKVKYYFTQRDILHEKYDEVKVVFKSKKYSFIPNELFDESYARNYLKLQYSIFNSEPIRYNIDLELKNVLVFSYQEDLEFFLESKYNTITYYHSIYVFLQNLTKKNLPIEYHINFYHTTFDFIGFKNSELIIATSFSYSSKEDVLYFVANYLTNNDQNPNEIPLFIYGNSCKLNEKIELLKKYFLSVEEVYKDNFERSFICLLENKRELIFS